MTTVGDVGMGERNGTTALWMRVTNEEMIHVENRYSFAILNSTV